MCLGVPARVVEVRGETALVDCGGYVREVDAILLPDVRVGDYVIISNKIIVTKIKEEHIAEMRTEMKAARAWQDSLHNAIKSVFTPQMIDLMDYPSNFFRDVSYITWIESIEQEQCFYSIINEMKKNKQFIDPVKNPWDK